MATPITMDNADFVRIKRLIMQDMSIKIPLLKSGLALNKQGYKDLFQGTENYMASAVDVTPTQSLKAAMEAACGKPLTGLQAAAAFEVWAKWRFA